MHMYGNTHSHLTEPLDGCIRSLVGMTHRLHTFVKVFLQIHPVLIQGGAKIGQRGLQRTSSSDRYTYMPSGGSRAGQKQVAEGLLLWWNPPLDQIVTATYWWITDDTCIPWNPAILVVFFRTELFADGYQSSNIRPFCLHIILHFPLWYPFIY